MTSFNEKMPIGGGLGAGRQIKLTKGTQVQPGVRNHINSELWHACAGPLVSLPQAGSLVYYFPQGHIEQVAVSTKKTTTSQIPNYPDLPPQLLCQIQSLTMHADKDTDEVYAQMCLQPVISEKDVLPIPDFGLRPGRHPSEFFCKTLTASDTSTHGGFSVPRRSAEKLFPPLDYKMQPPTQELVVHDLHNNTWTFRHIYRGQPKRHLLTTGWSMFVGAKRLKAGDAVIFIRDERSRLLLGVRRANRQQTILPSSVLSSDSMHIGVLAAASHAAANRTPFRIFYNPRACPSEFVVPLPKYHKSVYGTQVSAGARFGMVSETEDSGTRRYMGTIVGISDLDSFRWPGSKWRNLQVHWDEPGSGDKQSRVSAWEIEIPDSLFIFPSLTSGADNVWGNLIRRPFIQVPGNGYGSHSCTSMPSQSSEQLLNLLLKPQVPNHCEASQNPHLVHSENTIQFGNHLQTWNGPSNASKPNLPSSMIPEIPTMAGGTKIAKPEPIVEQATQLASVNQQLAVSPLQVQMNAPFMPQQSESSQTEVSQLDLISPNALLPHMGTDEMSASPDFGPLDPSPMFGFQDPSSEIFLDISSTFPPSMGDMWDNQLTNSLGNYSDLRDLSDETNLSGIYGGGGGGGAVIDPSFIPSIPNTVFDEFGALKDSNFQSSDCLFGNFSSSQDARSQLTSASLPDSSGVTSSSNVDLDESSLLQNGSWKQVSPPLRTYTKVQKAGSVGRSIDVAAFKNYDELCCAIERMFGLEGLLNDPWSSGWKLVYVDYEDDVLLVGDDPWEVFVGCVRCIRILSPSEVQKMSEEGVELLNSGAMALRANLGH